MSDFGDYGDFIDTDLPTLGDDDSSPTPAFQPQQPSTNNNTRIGRSRSTEESEYPRSRKTHSSARNNPATSSSHVDIEKVITGLCATQLSKIEVANEYTSFSKTAYVVTTRAVDYDTELYANGKNNKLNHVELGKTENTAMKDLEFLRPYDKLLSIMKRCTDLSARIYVMNFLQIRNDFKTFCGLLKSQGDDCVKIYAKYLRGIGEYTMLKKLYEHFDMHKELFYVNLEIAVSNQKKNLRDQALFGQLESQAHEKEEEKQTQDEREEKKSVLKFLKRLAKKSGINKRLSGKQKKANVVPEPMTDEQIHRSDLTKFRDCAKVTSNANMCELGFEDECIMHHVVLLKREREIDENDSVSDAVIFADFPRPKRIYGCSINDYLEYILFYHYKRKVGDELSPVRNKSEFGVSEKRYRILELESRARGKSNEDVKKVLVTILKKRLFHPEILVPFLSQFDLSVPVREEILEIVRKNTRRIKYQAMFAYAMVLECFNECFNIAARNKDKELMNELKKQLQVVKDTPEWEKDRGFIRKLMEKIDDALTNGFPKVQSAKRGGFLSNVFSALRK